MRNAYARATGAAPAAATDAEEGRREIAENDDCPVCYDSLSGPAPLEWCRGCGNSLHTACLTQWKTTKRSQGAAVTCVYCRREWVDGSAGVAAGKVMKEGYLNLAAEAGLSGRRDTSTYYHGPRRGGRSSRYDDEFDEEEEDEEEFEGYRYGQRAYY